MKLSTLKAMIKRSTGTQSTANGVKLFTSP